MLSCLFSSSLLISSSTSDSLSIFLSRFFSSSSEISLSLISRVSSDLRVSSDSRRLTSSLYLGPSDEGLIDSELR